MKNVAHYRSNSRQLIRITVEEPWLAMNTAETKTMMFGERNIDQAVQIAGTTTEKVDKSLRIWEA